MDILYPIVEKVAEKHFYNGDKYGTIPFFISDIFSEAAGGRKAKSKYLKSIGYNFNTIKNLINAGNPVILNISNDGVGKYRNHSVTIFGYVVYKIDNDKTIFTLLVYDNWTKEIRWVVYNKLSTISSITYLA